MLTKDLLRFAIQHDVITPRWLKTTPAVVQLATDLVDFYRKNIGLRRGELDDQVTPTLHRSRSLPVAKGLQKLILDRCVFTEPEDAVALREQAFTVSAARILAPDTKSLDHRDAIAEILNMDGDMLSESLYADLPDQATLTKAPHWDAHDLIANYNLSLAQSLLLRTRELRVTINDTDVGMRRRLLKALRWRRLMALARGNSGGPLELTVSGPDSVLDQQTRYGLNLAQWLPALACARSWTMTCDVPGEQPGQLVTLTLSNEHQLPGDSHFLGYVPDELRDLERQLADKIPAWTWNDPDLIPSPDGEIIVPDMQFTNGERVIRIELFHRWHAHALQRRLRHLDTLAKRSVATNEHLLIGVDKQVAKHKAIAPLLTQAAFTTYGFLFNALPTPTGLTKVLKGFSP